VHLQPHIEAEQQHTDNRVGAEYRATILREKAAAVSNTSLLRECGQRLRGESGSTLLDASPGSVLHGSVAGLACRTLSCRAYPREARQQGGGSVSSPGEGLTCAIESKRVTRAACGRLRGRRSEKRVASLGCNSP
jgi:hypothetical protein